MKQYEIFFEEINYGCTFVEANSKEEAIALAKEVYQNGDISWTGSTCEVKKVDVY